MYDRFSVDLFMICALKDRYLYLLMTLWIPWFFTPVRFTRFFSPGIYFSVYIDNYKFNSGAFYLAREPFSGCKLRASLNRSSAGLGLSSYAPNSLPKIMTFPTQAPSNWSWSNYRAATTEHRVFSRAGPHDIMPPTRCPK